MARRAKHGERRSGSRKRAHPLDVAASAIGADALRWRTEHPAFVAGLCADALQRDTVASPPLYRRQRSALTQLMLAAIAEAPAATLAGFVERADDTAIVLDLEFYRLLAERLPSDSRALHAYARQLIARSQLDDAATVLWQAIDHDPSAALLLDLGFLLVKRRRRGEAERLAAIATARFPHDPRIEQLVRTIAADAAWV